jgi:inositol transport system substrate-binding protein
VTVSGTGTAGKGKEGRLIPDHFDSEENFMDWKRYWTSWWVILGFGLLLLLSGCGKTGDQAVSPSRTIGVAFETLQTEYWVASLEAIREELKKRDIKMLEAIADGDANRQLEQINNFIVRKVDGMIVVPKDAQTIIPMIKTANQANIPIVLYNRPPDKSDARSTTVAADNYQITRATVEKMVEVARAARKKFKALILVGDLGDINSIGRRDGFEDVARQNSDILEVVSRVPTEWNQEKALAGVTNALQAHPDISFIFSSSDLLLPSVVSSLKNAGKYKKVGEEGHVILGSFDGDATAYQMLKEGYLDADGVQDAYFESASAVQAVLDANAGKAVPETILDPGYVIHQGNLAEAPARMWGARIKK